ncbi:hypothetical protein ACFLU6_10575, partial [Acidobacteriota bacterium]
KLELLAWSEGSAFSCRVSGEGDEQYDKYIKTTSPMLIREPSKPWTEGLESRVFLRTSQEMK